MFKNKRRGRIRVALDVVEHPEIMKVLFSEFTPVISGIDFNRVDYSGFSEHFREVAEGEMSPYYDAMITRQENGVFTVEFVEIK